MDRLTNPDFKFTSNYVAQRIQSFPIAQCLSRLQEYEDLEEQGLLVRLPCKVGDTVYIPREKNILKRVIDCVLFDGSLKMVVTFGCDYECAKCIHHRPYENFEGGDCGSDSDNGIERFEFDNIGKTVFPTREAAEKALAERSKQNG